MKGSSNIRLIVLIVVFLLSISFVSAASTITSSVVNNVITTSEVAQFTIQITNNNQRMQSYTLYSFTSGQGFSVDPTPLSDKVIENLAGGDTYTTTISVNPTDDFDPGIYYVQLQVDGDLGESYSVPLKTYVLGEEAASYLPSIISTVDIESLIDPRESQSIVLHLENRNPLNLSGLEIEIQSDMDEFNVQRQVDLLPLEKKTVEFSVTPNPYQQPKEYSLFFVFKRNGDPIKVVEERVVIESLSPTFDVEVTGERTVFLKTFQELTVTNEGNIRNSQIVKQPATIFSSFFAKADGISTIVEDGSRFVAWEVELGPGESTVINVVFSYRLLVYLLVVLSLFLAFYYAVQAPLILKKGVIATVENKKGSIEEIKITLDIRNRSKKPLRDVLITDILPGITHLDKGVDLGTLKPHKVKNSPGGKKVEWKLAEVEPLEHRIITYSIKPKLDVLGTLQLPRAIAEYKKQKGKVVKSYSNVFRLDLGKLKI